jgi:prophage DNA circulation protein
MTLSPMRFKSYVWPHNPRTYEIEFRRGIVTHKVPFGAYTLQNLGRTNRVLRGEGEFCGAGAYEEFKKLASVFYEDTPGILVHPLWQTANAYFADLSLKEVPTQDYVSYTFEFWECFDGYESGAVKVSYSGGTSLTAASAGKTSGKSWYTVKSGDCMWNIANACGLTLAELVALNPQVKNPNLIYPGDVLRTA